MQCSKEIFLGSPWMIDEQPLTYMCCSMFDLIVCSLSCLVSEECLPKKMGYQSMGCLAEVAIHVLDSFLLLSPLYVDMRQSAGISKTVAISVQVHLLT